MRDCLSLTDQSIAQGNGNISRADVQQMLGGVDRDWVFKILIALLKQDAPALMQLSLTIASYAPSYSRLSAELMQLLHQVAMAQLVETHFSLPAEHRQMLTRFCQLMSPEDVQLYYQIVLSARKDFPYADDEQAAFDMMLLRLLAFKPVVNSANLPEAGMVLTDDNISKGIDELSLDAPTPLETDNVETNEYVESIVVEKSTAATLDGDQVLADAAVTLESTQAMVDSNNQEFNHLEDEQHQSSDN